jgi:hypothetical protein
MFLRLLIRHKIVQCLIQFLQCLFFRNGLRTAADHSLINTTNPWIKHCWSNNTRSRSCNRKVGFEVSLLHMSGYLHAPTVFSRENSRWYIMDTRLERWSVARIQLSVINVKFYLFLLCSTNCFSTTWWNWKTSYEGQSVKRKYRRMSFMEDMTNMNGHSSFMLLGCWSVATVWPGK